MALTQKSEEELERWDNGSGVVFIKTGNNEMALFKFYRARNGKFNLAGERDTIEVMEVLAEIVDRTPEDII